MSSILRGIRLFFSKYFRFSISELREKEKSKRAAERLALYRDWPPDMVDDYICFETETRCCDSTPGYLAWRDGVTYGEYKANPRSYDGIILRKCR